MRIWIIEMITDYLPDDVLQYVVNEYMSHHPEDIDNLNKCVRSGFVFNISKYVHAITTNLPLRKTEYRLFVDGYSAIYKISDDNGLISQTQSKYGKLHGYCFYTYENHTTRESNYVAGYIHGLCVTYEYSTVNPSVRQWVLRTRTQYDMGTKHGYQIKEVKSQNNFKTPKSRSKVDYYYDRDLSDTDQHISYGEFSKTSHVVYCNGVITHIM